MGTSQKRKAEQPVNLWEKKKNLFNSTSILQNGGKSKVKLVAFKYN